MPADGESTTTGLPTVRIFISSPGDVKEERAVALGVIRHLQARLQGRIVLVPILWEQEPLLATAGFQQEIDRRAPPSASDIALFILWARLGTPLSRDFTLPDGRRPTGTEWEYEDALRASRTRHLPHILVYRKSIAPSVSVTDPELERRRADFEKVEAFFEHEFRSASDLAFTGSYHSFSNAAAFGERLEAHLLKLLTERLAGDQAAKITWHGTPFRGLETFEAEHSSVYFGRTRAVQEVRLALTAQVKAGRGFVLVVGSSGCGKSSLVRAGLVPLISGPWVIEEDLTGGLCRTAILKPGDAPTPLTALARALLHEDALPDLASDGGADELAATFADSARAAQTLVRGSLRRAAGIATSGEDAQPARLLMVLDQLEELFTREGVTEADRRSFAEVVAALARGGDTYVLATLRSDFYPAFARLTRLMEIKEGAGHYDLGPPDAAEIAQIIRGPAQIAGLSFEANPERGTSLDDDLLAEACRHADALPLLEYTLTLLEERSSDRVLTLAAYRELGGIQGAVRERAETEWASLPEPARAAFPSVLRGLVEVAGGKGTRAVRRRAPLSEIARGSGGRELVERFVGARLFVADGEGEHATVEVAHEALLRTWDRASLQIEAEEELLRIRGRVRAQAARWAAQSSDASLLLAPGRPLEEARLLRGSAFDLTETERTYIAASERRARRGRNVRLVGVATIALLAVLAGLQALRAERERKRAAESAKDAWEAQRETQVALDDAESARLREEEQRRRAEDTTAELKDAERDLLFAKDYAEDIRDLEILARQKAELRATEAKIARLEATNALEETKRARAKELRSHYVTLISLASQQIAASQFDLAIESLESAPEVLRDWEWGQLWLRSHTAERTLLGHRGGVLAVAVAPDGTKMATGGRDGAVRLWDGATGASLLTLPASRGAVWGLAFSPDGTRLLSGGDDGRLRLWDPSNGTCLRVVVAHERDIRAVAFDRTGARWLSAGAGHEVKLWSGADASLLATLDEHTDTVRALAVSPDGASLLTTGHDGRVKWWNLETHSCEQTWEAHDDPITGVAFVGDERFVTCSRDQTAKVWQRTNPTAVRVFRDHTDAVLSVAARPDSALVATGSTDRTIRLWHPDEEGPAEVLHGHSQKVVSLAFDTDGQSLVSGSTDQSARRWPARIPKRKVAAHDGGLVSSLAFARKKPLLASGGSDGVVRIWRLAGADLQPVRSLTHGPGTADAVALAADGSLVASGGGDGSVRVWHVANGELACQFTRKEAISTLRFDRAGGLLLVASADGTAGTWNATTGAEMQVIQVGEAVSAATWGPDQTAIFTATVSGDIEEWDVQTGERQRTLPQQGAAVWVLCFTPDGAHLLVGRQDKTLRVLDASTGETVRDFPTQAGPVTAVALNDTGTRAALATVSRAVAVFDAHEGHHVLTLPEADPLVSAVAFEPTGRVLVVGRVDGSLHIWGSTPWEQPPTSTRIAAPNWRELVTRDVPEEEAQRSPPPSGGRQLQMVTCPWCGTVQRISVSNQTYTWFTCAFCGGAFKP